MLRIHGQAAQPEVVGYRIDSSVQHGGTDRQVTFSDADLECLMLHPHY